MTSTIIRTITKELNKRSGEFQIGRLQHIRKELYGFKRLPAKTIFSEATTFDDWAFHHGGRRELQFNVGIEHKGKRAQVRFGAAFSLETSQTVPSIDLLLPSIGHFNDYLIDQPKEFLDLRMWHMSEGIQSNDYIPSPIPASLIKNHTFIFIGVRQPIEHVDYDAGLTVMDRLLPLYLYTRTAGNSASSPSSKKVLSRKPTPGFTPKATTSSATLAEKELNFEYRHNRMQELLYKKLIKQFGYDKVFAEQMSGKGAYVDLMTKTDNGYWFYEIKTAHTARLCIREALGQIIEYSFWPGHIQADRLIIVGEPELDKAGKSYLSFLRKRFSLPLHYKRIKL